MDNFVSFVRIPVVVVLPLVNLMKDQVSYLISIGVSSISLSDLKEREPGKVVKAAYSVVFYIVWVEKHTVMVVWKTNGGGVKCQVLSTWKSYAALQLMKPML